jgi:lipoprotein-releasing system permease protein
MKNIFWLTWLSYRMLFSKTKSLFSGTAWVSFVGLVIGVACLVVSMAVMSGFESTLKKSVADVTGHLRIRKQGSEKENWLETFQKLQKLEPEIVEFLPYAYLEGVVAGGGRLSGVLLQGVDEKNIDKVLDLKSRLVQGNFEIIHEQIPTVLLGKGLAQQFALSAGDQFKLVFPLPSDLDPTQFRRKIQTFRVGGVLDLGKKEFDDRLIVASLKSLQKMSESERVSGILVRIKNMEQAREMGMRLSRELGPSYQISDWKEINENLFEAVQIERVVVFFVILIIIVAAAFNVSSTLYINVVKRYPDIGILKSLGLSKNKIIKIFSLQGLMMGMMGLFLGILLGLVFCSIFTWAEARFGLIPTSVYKLDRIDLNVRFVDLISISLATILISFIATLFPALKGAELSPVEGIKHE